MLSFALQQVPFRFGLSEGTDPRQVPPGTLLTAENAIWTKSGRLGKRFGTQQLSNNIVSGGSIAAASRLFTRNSGAELCLVDGSKLYSYSANANAWTNVAAVPDAGLTQRALLDPVLGVQASDSATSGNYVVTAVIYGDPTNQAAGTVYAMVTDLTTGATLMPPTSVGNTGYGVRVVISGTLAVIVHSGVNATVYAASVDLTTMTVSATLTSLRTDRINTVSQNWDAKLIDGTGNLVIAYGSGATNIKLYSYDVATLTQQATSTQAVANNTTRLSVDATSGESVYVAYYETGTTSVKAYIADPATLAVTVAPFVVQNLTGPPALLPALSIGVTRYSATQAVVAYTGNAVAVPTLTSKIITSAGAVTAASHRQVYGAGLISAPFMVGGKCYAFGAIYPRVTTPVAPFSGNACGLFCLYPGDDNGALPEPASQPTYIANVESLLGAKNGENCPVFRFTPLTATRAVGSVPFIGTPPSANITWRCGLRLLQVTTGADLPADMWRAVSVGAETYINAAVPSVYDGCDVFDYGFPYAPSLQSLTTAGAGGLILVGGYIYATYAEYRSAAGMLYRGPTVVSPLLGVAGPTSANTLVFGHVNVGNKRHINAVERATSLLPIYRTVAGGSTPQRLTYDPGFNVLPLDYTSATQTLVDTRGDASIDGAGKTLASRPALYTGGGVLDDYSPPASLSMFYHADRLWNLASDGKTWWYSKAFQDDLGTAPGYNPSFRISFDEVQTAGASMDDKAIFFSAAGVRYMLGFGPSPSGQNSDFVAPTRIQSDVGCTNPRSTVGTPEGVMFLSARGIYLLTRGLDLVWIGMPVQDKLAAFPNVTSAVLVAKANQVRFTCNDVAGTSGIVLVYDYVEKQWTTAKYWVGGVYGSAIADACMWNGAWTFVSTAGVVYSESATSYLDASGNYYVPMTLETAWISAAGPIAFQAVRAFALHGESFTDHDLTVQVGFDSSASYAQTATFLATSPTTSVGVEECEVSIGTRRKCSTIRFKISDTTPSAGALGTGQGPAFDMMGLEVGVERGFKKIPATQRA